MIERQLKLHKACNWAMQVTAAEIVPIRRAQGVMLRIHEMFVKAWNGIEEEMNAGTE